MGKFVDLPKTNLMLLGFGMDANGNRIVKLGYPNKRGFSIQTNGALKNTDYISDRVPKKRIEALTQAQLKQIKDECVDYIQKYGSKLQKKTLKVY